MYSKHLNDWQVENKTNRLHYHDCYYYYYLLMKERKGIEY